VNYSKFEPLSLEFKSFLLCVSHWFCNAHSDNIFVIVLFHIYCIYLKKHFSVRCHFCAIFCSCSKHQNVVRQRSYDIFHSVYICIWIFAKHHTFITCEYILLLLLFFCFHLYRSFDLLFVINLYWCFFLCLGWNSSRQTCFVRNDDQRPCVAYVWLMVILSFFSLSFFCALHVYYSLFFVCRLFELFHV